MELPHDQPPEESRDESKGKRGGGGIAGLALLALASLARHCDDAGRATARFWDDAIPHARSVDDVGTSLAPHSDDVGRATKGPADELLAHPTEPPVPPAEEAQAGLEVSEEASEGAARHVLDLAEEVGPEALEEALESDDEKKNQRQ